MADVMRDGDANCIQPGARFDQFIELLQHPESADVEDFCYVKSVLASFEGCSELLISGIRPSSSQVVAIFGAIKAHLLFGLPGFSLSLPCLLDVVSDSASKSSQPVPTSPAQACVKKRRKAKPNKQKRLAAKSLSTNETQVSDSSDDQQLVNGVSRELETRLRLDPHSGSENGLQQSSSSDLDEPCRKSLPEPNWDSSAARSRFYGFIRRKTLELASQLINVSQNANLHGLWLHFFPDPKPSYFCPGHGTRGLAGLLLKEPLYDIRVAVLKTIGAFLQSCRPMLNCAQAIRGSPGAFVSYSEVVCGSLVNLHRMLFLALRAEQRRLVITQVLKTITIFVACTPYGRFYQVEFDVHNQLRSFLTHKDPNIRVACGSCYAALLNANLSSDLVQNFLQWNKDSTLWDFCVAGVLDVTTVLPVRIELISLMNVILKRHYSMLKATWFEVLNQILQIEGFSDADLRLHGCRLLKTFLNVISLPPVPIELNSLVSCWDIALSRSQSIKCMGNCPSAVLAVELCEIMLFIPEQVGHLCELLDLHTVLLDLMNSKDSRVKCAAIPALLHVAVITEVDVTAYTIGTRLLDEVSDTNIACAVLEKLLQELSGFLTRKYDKHLPEQFWNDLLLKIVPLSASCAVKNRPTCLRLLKQLLKLFANSQWSLLGADGDNGEYLWREISGSLTANLEFPHDRISRQCCFLFEEFIKSALFDSRNSKEQMSIIGCLLKQWSTRLSVKNWKIMGAITSAIACLPKSILRHWHQTEPTMKTLLLDSLQDFSDLKPTDSDLDVVAIQMMWCFFCWLQVVELQDLLPFREHPLTQSILFRNLMAKFLLLDDFESIDFDLMRKQQMKQDYYACLAHLECLSSADPRAEGAELASMLLEMIAL